jgi:hypothetical protein
VSQKTNAFIAKNIEPAIEYTIAVAKKVTKKGEATRKILIFIASATMSLRSCDALLVPEVS